MIARGLTRRHFNTLARAVWDAKGWEVIDWTGVSAALAFDAALQGDGLHVAGPPMKVAVHLLLNVMCAD